ncbi:MAG: DUF1614 domain-containing protein [Alphaproteobacteria bacterium]|nr:DUF1614 domain-containing protein [Alphaproteobacteria bacterium]
MPTSNRLSLLAAVFLLVLLPFFFTQVALVSLQKLHLSPDTAFNLMLGIIFGGLVNIPIKRIVQVRPVWSHPLAVFGLDTTLPRWLTHRRETIIAVNVGGCLIPVGIALYQLTFLIPLGKPAISALALATIINIVVCFFVAKPVAGVGIVMPGFVAPLTAAASAILLAPDFAPPVAFVAGVIGPLVGADFLHIGAFIRTPVAVASIGGAGTFDGIVLSGIIAAFLA